MKVSIVILTYNRPQCLERQLARLRPLHQQLGDSDLELLVVDNASTSYQLQPYIDAYPEVRFIRNSQNVGAVGRNSGMAAATGDLVITLDDDVFGISPADIARLRQLFSDEPQVAAVCFKVVDAETGELINWCHRHDKVRYQDQRFLTYEISEGAVALRRQPLTEVGLYPDDYFISHEGIDLALRLIERGYQVLYLPDVVVSHEHAVEGRPSWRRYYYDSRNLLWLTARYYGVELFCKRCFLQLLALAVYALRDGHLMAYLRGLGAGLRGMPQRWRGRQGLSRQTLQYMRAADRHSPPLWQKVRERLFRKSVRI